MLASRQLLGACQRRAFSVSARQVSFGQIQPAAIEHDTKTVYQASKVTVLGAGGGIGQPLSLLMKLNPRVTELALYDIRGAPGGLCCGYGPAALI